jgi:hypothetical protein
MSRCDEIQASAAYLAALPKTDRERELALEHARGCAACAEALAEGERIMAMIDALPPLPEPVNAALKRASEPILGELEARRAQRDAPSLRARNALIWASSIIGGWCVALALAKHRAEDRASWLWSALILAASVLGLGGIMSFDAPVTAAAVVASGLFSSVLGRGGMLFPAIGVKCVLIELIAASLPLAVTAFLVVRRSVVGGAWRFSAAAALGALAGQAGLHLTCPVSAVRPHLLVFHTGGVLLAALVGLAVSRIPRLQSTH